MIKWPPISGHVATVFSQRFAVDLPQFEVQFFKKSASVLHEKLVKAFQKAFHRFILGSKPPFIMLVELTKCGELTCYLKLQENFVWFWVSEEFQRMVSTPLVLTFSPFFFLRSVSLSIQTNSKCNSKCNSLYHIPMS